MYVESGTTAGRPTQTGAPESKYAFGNPTARSFIPTNQSTPRRLQGTGAGHCKSQTSQAAAWLWHSNFHAGGEVSLELAVRGHIFSPLGHQALSLRGPLLHTRRHGEPHQGAAGLLLRRPDQCTVDEGEPAPACGLRPARGPVAECGPRCTGCSPASTLRCRPNA